jgi:release factor glutamine methyltransferase
MARVYGPAEDSMLLLRNAEGRIRGSVLDMGTGRGVLAIAAASEPRVTRVVAVDIDPEAVALARGRAEEQGVSERIEFRVGDLFEGLEAEEFDWILFNPPYLPSEGVADEASWSGGESGKEAIERFLGDAISYLKPSGAILIVYSSQTGLDLKAVERDYAVEVLEKLPLFFEVLFCLMLRPLSPSVGPGKNRR